MTSVYKVCARVHLLDLPSPFLKIFLHFSVEVPKVSEGSLYAVY